MIFKIKNWIFLIEIGFFYLNQIMFYITIFYVLPGYCSYNYHNYVNNLAE